MEFVWGDPCDFVAVFLGGVCPLGSDFCNLTPMLLYDEMLEAFQHIAPWKVPGGSRMGRMFAILLPCCYTVKCSEHFSIWPHGGSHGSDFAS